MEKYICSCFAEHLHLPRSIHLSGHDPRLAPSDSCSPWQDVLQDKVQRGIPLICRVSAIILCNLLLIGISKAILKSQKVQELITKTPAADVWSIVISLHCRPMEGLEANNSCYSTAH